MLLGRRAERERISALLDDAGAGRSGTLVVRGEAGVGKSALLEHARELAVAAGFRVEAAVGLESETQFAFAALHQLCMPLLDRADALSEPQRAALDVAFGLRAGATPDRFLVGLAALSLVAEAAETGPVLCLVDDAQWLDPASAQVLAFVARRLVAERVLVLFAVRDPDEGAGVDPCAGLPELRVEGLGESDARALLDAAIRTPLDVGVRDRLVAEARGNPLALLELPRGAPPARLAGGFGLPDVPSVPRRVEDGFRQRSADLPVPTQLLLLTAAAEPTGDPALLWRAADHLGIDRDTMAPAEAAGLLEIHTRVRFRHPLVRSAVYRAAPPPDRRRAHLALAAATDADRDPDRRAWHHSQAAQGPDEEVAAELERSADRACARGGLAAGAAFLQQATALSEEPNARGRRALGAALATHEAGASDAALALLDVAAASRLDDLERARLSLLRAQITFHLRRGSDAPRLFLEAAATLAPLDPPLSRETYLRAMDAAILVSGLSHGRGVVEVATAARSAPAAPAGPARPADLLLDGLVSTFTQGYGEGTAVLREALRGFRDCDASTHDDGVNGRWYWLACRTAAAVFDDDLVYDLAELNVRVAREAGALTSLPSALLFQSCAFTLAGDVSRSAELAAEGSEIARALGLVPLHHARLLLAAWRGRAAEAAAISAEIVRDATPRDEGAQVSFAQWAMSMLHNGLGDYAAAQAAAGPASASEELPHSNLALPELVEAAVRSGEVGAARAALLELEDRARAAGTGWALGVAARSRALVSSGTTAEDHYREAIDQLRDCRMASHVARTHLLYGEWLRREGRRRQARDELHVAHEQFSTTGANAFAERAARELRATGETVRRRTPRPSDLLTAQEAHVARLVATGRTSREVGAELYLSPRTIEAHLRSIFRKLEITSRRELRTLPLP